MILIAFPLALAAQCSLVCGQILLKRAVTPATALTAHPSALAPHPSAVAARSSAIAPRPLLTRPPIIFALAITCMTLYFFTWLGVAAWLPLSQLAPFDAFGPVLLVIWARLALGERLTPRAWLAVLVILIGVTIIACS